MTSLASSRPAVAARVVVRAPARRATRAPSRVAARAIAESGGDGGEDIVLPAVKAADSEIPAPVGTAGKDEFMRWLTNSQRLPAQKLDLVVDLPEGRGLVAREDVKRGEPLLEIPEASLITVERAVKESKLGPKHA